MSRPPCPVPTCDRPAASGLMCGACQAELARALDAVPEVVRELDTTLSRQTSRTGAGSGEIETDRAALVLRPTAFPYSGKASDAIDELKTILVGWARVLMERDTSPPPADTLASVAAWLRERLSALVAHEAAEEAHREILGAMGAAERAVDRHPDRWYAGVCAAALDGDERCQRDLYAKSAAAIVACPACGTRWDLVERRQWLLGMAEDVLATATEIARAVTTLGQPVTPEAIRGYVHRKQLFPHGSRVVGTREVPVYRLGDVLDILARRAERTEEKTTA